MLIISDNKRSNVVEIVMISAVLYSNIYVYYYLLIYRYNNNKIG